MRQEHRLHLCGGVPVADKGGGGQGALASRLPGAIHINEDTLFALAIPQSTHYQFPRTHLLLKEVAQPLQAGMVDRSKEPIERSAIGQAGAPEERHEGGSKGRQARKERFQRGFEASGIPHEESDFVALLIPSAAAPRQMNAALRGPQAVPGERGDEPGQRFRQTMAGPLVVQSGQGGFPQKSLLCWP